MFKYVVFALIFYKSVEAYVGILPKEEKPARFADQDGCYFAKFDGMLKVDVPFTPIDSSTCEQYTCKESGEIFKEGCSEREISDNCERLPADFTKAFPDCCKKVRCTFTDGQSIEF